MKEERISQFNISEMASACNRLREAAGCTEDPAASQEKLESYVLMQLDGFLTRMDDCDDGTRLGDYTMLRTALHCAALDKAVSHRDFYDKLLDLLDAAEIYSNSSIVSSLAPISPAVKKRLDLSNAIHHLAKTTLIICADNRAKIGEDSIVWNSGLTPAERLLAIEQNRHIDPDDIRIAMAHIGGSSNLPKVFHCDTFARELVLRKYSRLPDTEIRRHTSANLKKDIDEILNSSAMEYMRNEVEGKVLSRDEAINLYNSAAET